jgi:hypothetical protein
MDLHHLRQNLPGELRLPFAGTVMHDPPGTLPVGRQIGNHRSPSFLVAPIEAEKQGPATT